MQIVDEKIKELYNNDKAFFCEKYGYNFKNFARKVSAIENKLTEFNDFFNKLDLEIQIAPISAKRAIVRAG